MQSAFSSTYCSATGQLRDRREVQTHLGVAIVYDIDSPASRFLCRVAFFGDHMRIAADRYAAQAARVEVTSTSMQRTRDGITHLCAIALRPCPKPVALESA